MRARSSARPITVGGTVLLLLFAGAACQDESGASDDTDSVRSSEESLDDFCARSEALSGVEVDPSSPDPAAAQAVVEEFGEVEPPEAIRSDVEELGAATEAALASAPGTDGQAPTAEQLDRYTEALERIEVSSARIEEFVRASC